MRARPHAGLIKLLVLVQESSQVFRIASGDIGIRKANTRRSSGETGKKQWLRREKLSVLVTCCQPT